MVARRSTLAVLMVLALLPVLTTVAPQGAVIPGPPNPRAGGDYAWESMEYDFGYTVVLGEPAQPYLANLRGSVHVPLDAPAAKVLVFMHGRHATCDVVGIEFLVPLCQDSAVSSVIRSYQGYDYIAANLASHGYAVISVDANAINDVDLAAVNAGGRARGELVLRTLDAFHARNGSAVNPLDGIGDRLVGRLDFSRVGLMGHSRGGEGVVRAAIQDQAMGAPYNITAAFALAPIDAMGSRIGSVHLAVLLPYCDGDVSDLSGARIYDTSRYLPGDAHKHQILLLGANHNWFNTVWTSDDSSFGDEYCRSDGGGRLTMTEQRALGLAYIASFLRAHVGGEAEFLPYLTGEQAFSGMSCPFPFFSRTCAEVAHVSHQSPTRLVVEDAVGTALTGNDLGGNTTITAPDALTAGVCTPRICPLAPTRGAAAQVAVRHNGSFTYQTDFAVQDVSSYAAFSFRATFGGNGSVDPAVALTLQDADGGRQTVDITHASLYVPPGSTGRDFVLNMVRVPLSRFTDVDLAQVTAVEIAIGAQPGEWVQFADLMFRDPA